MSFMKSGSTEKNTEKRLSLSLAKVKDQKTVTAINEISPGRWPGLILSSSVKR